MNNFAHIMGVAGLCGLLLAAGTWVSHTDNVQPTISQNQPTWYAYTQPTVVVVYSPTSVNPSYTIVIVPGY